MIITTILVISLALVSAKMHPLTVNSIRDMAKDLDSSSSKSLGDLMALETGGEVAYGAGKEDIVAGKGFAGGIKAGHKKLDIGGKKLSKKFGKIEGKKFDKKFLKNDKKFGAFGAVGKGFKKFNKKNGFNKIGGSGYKKKSFHVKSFNENKAFKFGKVNGFKLANGVAAGFAKKGGKFKDSKLKAFDKKLKGGKKEFIDLNAAKGGKKLSEAAKIGFKKGGKKFIKKKFKGGKKLKKIG